MSLRSSVLVILVLFAAMQLLLPPEGFVTGDQGSKFLQTRAFATNGPFDPSIDVLSRDIDPEYRHQEPKLKNRRGRLVSEFLWLLPLLSAPFYRLVGIRGLYAVPALSVIAAFLAIAALARRCGEPRPVRTAWIVMLVTPVALYGLELWEHAPAAACVVAAAVWLVPLPAGRVSTTEGIAAGAAIAIGTLFREEVFAALPALLVARAVALDGDRIKDAVFTGVLLAVGALVVLVASIPMNVLMYGAALPMHVTQDAWEAARNTPYLQVRRDVIRDLLLPASHEWFFAAAIAAGVLGALFRRIRVVHAACATLLVVTVVLPLWRLAAGVQPTLSYRVTSAAHTWTFASMLLYWPWIATGSWRKGFVYLVVGGALLFAGSALVIPTSGGAQWSPRFMLAVAPLIAVAVSRALIGAPRVVATVVFAASMVMQITGVGFVVRSKMRHAAMVHSVAAQTPNGGVLISDVYWFPEITATLAHERRFLFSWSSADIPAMAAIAAAGGFAEFELVTSAPLTGYQAPLQLSVPGAACTFARGRQSALDASGLTLSHYQCRAP